MLFQLIFLVYGIAYAQLGTPATPSTPSTPATPATPATPSSSISSSESQSPEPEPEPVRKPPPACYKHCPRSNEVICAIPQTKATLQYGTPKNVGGICTLHNMNCQNKAIRWSQISHLNETCVEMLQRLRCHGGW